MLKPAIRTTESKKRAYAQYTISSEHTAQVHSAAMRIHTKRIWINYTVVNSVLDVPHRSISFSLSTLSYKKNKESFSTKEGKPPMQCRRTEYTVNETGKHLVPLRT